MAPKTNTCPIGESGINKIITTGIKVMVSLIVRLPIKKNALAFQQEKHNTKKVTNAYLNVRTSLGFSVYP